MIKIKTLKDSVEINVSPELVWDWLSRFAENYCDWHPAHVKAYWEKGEPNEIDSVLYTEEELGGRTLKMSIRVSKMIPNRLIEFKTIKALRIFLPRGAFEIEPSEKGCIVSAILVFRMGKLLSKIAKKIFKAVSEHMAEEGENLKKILESQFFIN